MEQTLYKGFTIEIDQDNGEDLNPRLWDNFGTIVCTKGKYRGIGDIGLGDSELRDGDYHLPLYVYDHGGITISTTPFNCQWDSGCIGYIYVTQDRIKEEYGIEEIDEEHADRALNILRAEIDLYDKYIRGEVYGVVCNTGDLMDSCTGFYSKEDAIQWGKETIDAEIKDRYKKHFKYLKKIIKSKVDLIYRNSLNLENNGVYGA